VKDFEVGPVHSYFEIGNMAIRGAPSIADPK
jgi:hypothetical protein